MKLIAVLGSNRPGSVSERAAKHFIDGAKAAGYDEVRVFSANDMNIRGCRGCGSCRKNDTDCVIEDDFAKYLSELKSCDALLVTAPNYYSQVAGPMMTFMNRHYCLTRKDKTQRLRPGIKVTGIFAQGAPEDYPKYPSTYEWYMGTFAGKGMENCGMLIIGGDSDIARKLDEAYEMGRSL
ncbi:MAG: flavodoxin family protein [Ruminococcus sp.]|nr:flavodoxin family protein [Ruminococcus sp.]